MLVDFFEDLVDSEIRIQKLRVDFNREYELSPYEQYLKLKISGCEFCDRNSMIGYLQKFDFVKGPKEVDLIFFRFDKDMDGRFYFSEVNLFYLFYFSLVFEGNFCGMKI